MDIKKAMLSMVVGLTMISILGCGQDLPFEYRYLSANTVEIKYLDHLYQLDRFGQRADVPFDYEFESDGDLDIVIGGKEYEIESPYDIDKPKKKKKKSVSKKRKTTGSKKK